MTSPTDGYQVGNAWIQVLPSFRLFHKKIAAEVAGIGDVRVPIEPEVSTKKAVAAVAAMDKRLSQTPIVKKLDLDERAFNAKMAVISAKRDALVLRIDADISALNARIADWERKRGNTKVNVDAEIAKAQAKISALTAQRDLVTVQFDVDSDKAEQKLTQLETQVNRISNIQHDINMEASDASRAISIVGGLTIALSVLGQVAPAAAAAVATVPTAVLAAAQGFGAIMAGLSGVGDATKALQAVEDEAVTSSGQAAQKRIAAAKRVAGAQSSLQRALEQADRSAIQGARQVSDARDALADAQVSAARRVEDAERTLASAQASARDAQEALTRARKDATERLEDLRLAVSGAALDEEAAVLAVERAQDRLNRARAAGMTGRPMAEIELEARQADQALKEVRERYGDLREEADEAARAGVDGNRQVVSAQRQAEQAAQRIQDAERDLTQARVDGARQVAKAQERVAEAQQQASWAAADASRAVADAQRALAEASTSAGDAGSVALDKLALALTKLTPEGQRFAFFLQNSVKPALQDIGAAAQETMLPKLQVAFDRLLTLAPLAEKAFAATGDVIGDLAIKGAEMITNGPWRADFATIVARNNRVLMLMGDAGLFALDATRSLTVAAGPLAERLAASARGLLDQFNTWIQNKRESGELQAWFAEMSVRIREFFETVGQLAGGVWDFLQALAPLGRVIMDIVGPLVQFVGALAEANPALTTAVALAVLATSTFVSFFRTMGGLTQAFSTSIGVFRKYRDGLIGVKDGADATTTAATRTAAATEAVGGAAGRSGGLLGRLRGGLDNVQTAYGTGSAAAKTWATTTTTAVGSAATAMQTRLVPALQGPIRELDKFSPATSRVQQAFGTMATAAQNTVSGIAGAVGGTVAAVGRGAAGVVGALGGPFGLAITAATVGLGFLISSQAGAAQAAAEHKAQIQGLTDALVESNGAVDDNVRKKIALNLSERGVIENARRFGLSIEELTSAVGHGGDAAKNFDDDIRGVAEEIIRTNGVSGGLEKGVRGLTEELLKNGGSARDSGAYIDSLANAWQEANGATDEATAAYKSQLIQLADLIGGYHGAKGDFKNAAQEQRDIADAQNDASTATDRHTLALKKLQDQVLGQINKDLAYRQSLQGLAEAQTRVANATKAELPAALLAQEQAMVDVITRAGELAYANSTATTETGKLRDSQIAQAQAAADLANKHEGPLPASLRTYLDTLGIVRDQTGQYKVDLDNIPHNVTTTAIFDKTQAEKDVIAFAQQAVKQWSAIFGGWFEGSPPPPPAPGRPPGRALGGIDIPAYAMGGIRPMSSRFAQIVPPHQPRLIGDRMRGPEAFIPINTEPRSVGILADAAFRMGFALLPLAHGALLGMQAGGVNQVGAATATGGEAALTLDVSTVDGFTAAVQVLIASGLVPLAGEVNATTTPALATLEEQAGVRAVAATVVLRDAFTATAAAVGASWLAITQASHAGVTAISGYLATLRQGIQQAGNAFAFTADWIGTAWARVRAAAADPIRWVLQFPVNAGLIAAWNRLNTDFAMGKPVAPVAVPFAAGGRVHGTGSEDKVRALLTPGEVVFDRLAIANLGGVAAVERFRRMARAGILGPEQRLGGQPGDAAERLKLMRAVPLDGLGFAYGGVQPHVALAGAEIEEKFGRLPGGIGGVGSRPNPSDHPFGLALDFMTMRDTALGNRIASFLVANAQRLAVKYLIWQQHFNDGAGWTPMADRGSVTANHFDHVHTSFLRLGQTGRPFSGLGAMFDPASYFLAAYDMINRVAGQFPGNVAAGYAATVATRAADAMVQFANTAMTQGGVPGNVESWRPLVLQALRMLGLPLDWADITLRRMNQESGGNPRAINLWDSNARNGDPSRGLMQTIMGTFQAYRDPRAPNDIYDPLANILASMRYTMARYKSLPAGYGRPGGYDGGGYLPPGYSTVYNGLQRPEMVLTDNQWAAMFSLATDNRAGGGEFRGQLYLSSGEFLGVVHGAIESANDESGRVLARRTR